MILEPAKLCDREAVNALARQVHELHVNWQPEYYTHTDCLYDPERFRQAIADDALYVAKMDGEIVGYVLLPVLEISHSGLVPSRTLKLEEICVADGCRHNGIGHQIMEDVQRIGRQKGCTDIRLTCAPQNEAAIALYESCGMTVKNIQYRLKL